jgi:hypothetical protein
MRRAVLAQQVLDVIALSRDFSSGLIEQLLANLNVDFELHVFVAKFLDGL